MSEYCEKQSPEIGGGYFFCQLLKGHAGKHMAQSEHTDFENPDWIVRQTAATVDRGILIDKVKRLERENAALRRVVEAARNVVEHLVPLRLTPHATWDQHYRTCAEAYDPDAECPIKMGEAGVQDLVKLLAELDAGEAR